MPFEMSLSGVKISWLGVPKLSISDLKETVFCSSGGIERVVCSGHAGTGVCSTCCKRSGATLRELFTSPKPWFVCTESDIALGDWH